MSGKVVPLYLILKLLHVCRKYAQIKLITDALMAAKIIMCVVILIPRFPIQTSSQCYILRGVSRIKPIKQYEKEAKTVS